MNDLTLKELAVPIIKAIDSFNYLLKSHHRRVAIISHYIGKKMNLSDDELAELVIAASLHDIGALSVQERDMLTQEDVLNPKPHCVMGARMLSTFRVFQNIATIIKYHHIIYEDYEKNKNNKVLFASFIIHLADRVDIFINPDKFILNQKEEVVEKIRNKVGTIFHPDVFEAFEEVAKADIFWIEINNMTMDQLFRKINFSHDYKLTIDNVMEFAHTISRIIDFRSRFTLTHSYTVAHLASYLGEVFGFSKEDCKKLMVAGYLHDIGKIGIDPSLIEKNNKLDGDEYNMMKLHPYYTGQILNELTSSQWFSDIVTWAERHHEKIDGTGYPFALKGEDINQGVKVLAFSDIITALMEERPYRKSLGIDEAFSIIEKQLAPTISLDMFYKITQNKEQIEKIVLKCQEHTFEEYV